MSTWVPWKTLSLEAPNITEERGDLHPAMWERPSGEKCRYLRCERKTNEGMLVVSSDSDGRFM